MIRFPYRPAMLVCVCGCLAWGQPKAEQMEPAKLAERARELARSGHSDQALPLYLAALEREPGNLEIRADYAAVLGWAERYSEAIAQFRRVLKQDPLDQPNWV